MDQNSTPISSSHQPSAYALRRVGGKVSPEFGSENITHRREESESPDVEYQACFAKRIWLRAPDVVYSAKQAAKEQLRGFVA
jgi:hypothetical protein